MENIDLDMHFEDGRRLRQRHQLPLLIGRDASCGLILKTWRVARHHARLHRRGAEIHVEDMGSIMGTMVNGRRVASYGPLTAHDELLVGPCLIHVLPAGPKGQKGDRQCSGDGLAGPSPSAGESGNGSGPGPGLVLHESMPALKPPLPDNASRQTEADSRAAGILAYRQRKHEALIEALQLRRRDISGMSDTALRLEAAKVLTDILAADTTMPPGLDSSRLVRELVDEAVGLGPLEPLLADPEITEIMVNRHDEIYVERAGRLMREAASFSSEQSVLGVIERIVSPLGRRIDDSTPMVDARLRDGSRVNAVIAPIALRGASLTIRKFPEKRLEMADLQATGALDANMALFLQHCVRLRKNMLVSGGTGSGKTSLLNILSNAIPAGERIVTIEDAAELRLNHEHLISLEARPANLEGRGRVDIRDLVRNSLRMRPDRIVVGECRGAEAFDMLAAMNTGHEGSLTTLHANSPRDALARLETMILMAGMDLPLAAIREHIASSIDIIVQLVRVSDGRRLVSAIVQLTGIESGRFQLQELFTARHGPPAVFSGCGILPEGFDQAVLPMEIFTCESVIGLDTVSGALHFAQGRPC